MKKGFTLAELLGVITLLAIICLIAFPPILDSIKKSKQNIDNSNNEIIFNATKIYIENHSNEVNFVDNKFCVKLQTLIDSGELIPNLVDSSTNQNIDSNKYVKVIKNTNEYNFYLVSENNC